MTKYEYCDWDVIPDFKIVHIFKNLKIKPFIILVVLKMSINLKLLLTKQTKIMIEDIGKLQDYKTISITRFCFAL